MVAAASLVKDIYSYLTLRLTVQYFSEIRRPKPYYQLCTEPQTAMQTFDRFDESQNITELASTTSVPGHFSNSCILPSGLCIK